MYSLMCLKLYIFFGKLNKTDVKIGTNKGAFTLNIEKNMYSVLSTNTQKASKKKKKKTYKEKNWLVKKLTIANKTSF